MSDTGAPPPFQRRIRYKGTHPKRFEEKYKELHPEKYGEEVSKVQGRGQTPAGTHRPIMVNEILEVLAPAPGELGLDATLGYGGHAESILQRISPQGRLFALDVDPIELPRTQARLAKLGFEPPLLEVRRMNFAGILQLGSEVDGFDFVLADLGVSSMQIDTPQRGFTYKADGPLDLRLNPERGVPAFEALASWEEIELRDLLTENADEPHARAIARKLQALRGTVRTTLDLARAVEQALAFLPADTRRAEVKKSQARVFQAIRIHVNQEFAVLDQFLRHLPQVMRPGGRVAILTFHSGEDRRVKKAFQEGLQAAVYDTISSSPARPSSRERHDNPRSTCAKLRWARRG